jgi:hypothetical protein
VADQVDGSGGARAGQLVVAGPELRHRPEHHGRHPQHLPLDSDIGLLAVNVDRAAVASQRRVDLEVHVVPAPLHVGLVAVGAMEAADENTVVVERHKPMSFP